MEQEPVHKIIGVSLIRLIAKFLIIRGGWILFYDFRAAVFTFRMFPNRVEQWGISILLLIFANSFLAPLFYIAGGIGMMFLRRWARLCAFFGLWFKVLYSLTTIMSTWYFQLVLHTKPLIVGSWTDPVLWKLISECIITLIEVKVIIFLMRPKVREQFK